MRLIRGTSQKGGNDSERSSSKGHPYVFHVATRVLLDPPESLTTSVPFAREAHFLTSTIFKQCVTHAITAKADANHTEKFKSKGGRGMKKKNRFQEKNVESKLVQSVTILKGES